MTSMERQRRARPHRGTQDAVAAPCFPPSSRRPAPRRPLELALLSPECPGQASAAAAFFARAAQRLSLTAGQVARPAATEVRYAGFSDAMHRLQPPLPPALQRRLGAGAKDFSGAGKVRVMLRVGGSGDSQATTLAVDQRKKQVTLADHSSSPSRSPVVAAPKMFAFDAIFTDDDSQADVCSNSLTEALHAVINGTDGCLFSFGAPLVDTARTTVGSPVSAASLGAVPCAIAWLFRAVAERKQRTGARFSVRVSAVEVCGASNHVYDLLKGYASEGEQPPGVYLREDPLFGTPLQHHSELRAPSAEKAAFYLDAALAARTSAASHLVFTLHVYQYSVAGLRGVAGGRSRLHIINLGDCHRNRSGKELTVSALASVLLAIFSGHKHLPHREHKLTQLLKDCFSSLMCHTTVLAHVSPLPCHYADTLATLQLAARMHRIRHRKIKFFGPSVVCNFKRTDSTQPTESSDVEPSSSEQSADTVIYVGATDEATDGEHPPTYTCKDTRGPSGKTSTSARQQDSEVADNKATSGGHRLAAGTRTVACRGNKSAGGRSVPLGGDAADNPGSDEQWVDGPRVSRSRAAEVLFKDGEVKETWVDGPLQRYGFMDEHKKLMIRSWVENQTSHIQKKGEPRSPALQETSPPGVSTDLVPSGVVVLDHTTPAELQIADSSVPHTDDTTQQTNLKDNSETTNSQQTNREISIDVSTDHFDVRLRIPVTEESLKQTPLKLCAETNVADKDDNFCMENYDDEYEIIEVEETAVEVSMQDSCLQVTEEEIAMCMEEREKLLQDLQLDNNDHPLHILSEENLTTMSTFTESTSASVNGRQQPSKPSFEHISLDEPINILLASSVNGFSKKPHNQDSRSVNNYTSQTHGFFTSASTTDNQRRKQHTGARIFHYHFPTRRSHNFGIFPDDLIKEDYSYMPVGVQSAYSEPVPQQTGGYTTSNLCENCKRNFKYFGSSIEIERQQYFKNDAYSAHAPKGLPWLAGGDVGDGRFSMLSLRHPDGASNPNLNEGRSSRETTELSGRTTAMMKDEEASPRSTAVDGGRSGGGVGSYDSGHESGSPLLKKQQQPQQSVDPSRTGRCESSGYESFPRDSECSSISSGQDSEVDLHDPGGTTPVLSCWQWMLCGSGGWTATGTRDKDDLGA